MSGQRRFCTVTVRDVGEMYEGHSLVAAQACFNECCQLSREGPGPIHGQIVTMFVSGSPLEVFDPNAKAVYKAEEPPPPELDHVSLSEVRERLDQRSWEPLTHRELTDIIYNLCNRVAELEEVRAND